MQAKITKRLVDAIEAEDGKAVVVFDSDLAGFALKVTPSGRKVYQCRYRLGGRATPLKTYTIGVHGSPLTADQARKNAELLLLQVKRGIDPAEEKKRHAAESRGAISVEDLSVEFLRIYCESKLKPGSLREYRRAFKTHINPRIGGLKVKDVTHGDIERLHYELRGIAVTANRVVQVLSKFFNWAIRAGRRADRQNPCQGLEKFKEWGRDRYLAPSRNGGTGRGHPRL